MPDSNQKNFIKTADILIQKAQKRANLEQTFHLFKCRFVECVWISNGGAGFIGDFYRSFFG